MKHFEDIERNKLSVWLGLAVKALTPVPPLHTAQVPGWLPYLSAVGGYNPAKHSYERLRVLVSFRGKYKERAPEQITTHIVILLASLDAQISSAGTQTYSFEEWGGGRSATLNPADCGNDALHICT